MTNKKIQFIVFTLKNLNFALPIHSVHKIVNSTAVYSSGVKAVGFTHLEQSEVTVVDLSRRFFQDSLNTEAINYLIIVRNTTGEFYGIPVAETPILLEVSVSMIRLLPESYRRADTLAVASHVAVIPTESTQLTVFLLDIDLLLPLCQEISTNLG